MTAAATAPRTDPFGDRLRERLMRRLAGAGAATLVFGVLFLWLPAGILIAAAALYLVGVPLSLLVEGRWPAPSRRSAVARYVLLGLLVGTVVAVALARPTNAWLAVMLAFAVPSGAVGGGVAAWPGLSLRGRWVPRTMAVGPAVILVAAVWVWWDARPPEPHDFLLILEVTPQARSEFGDAEGLARAVAEGFERAAGRNRSLLAHETWVEVVGAVLDRPLGNAELWARYWPDLPTGPDGQPLRLITVGLGEDRACVLVTRDRATVHRQRCAALDLAATPNGGYFT